MTDQPQLSPIQPTRRNVLAGLPEYLKDPKIYPKIHKALLEELSTRHSHGTIEEYAKCFHCQRKFQGRSEMIRNLGFKSIQQFFAWQKVMDIIIFHRRKKLKADHDE